MDSSGGRRRAIGEVEIAQPGSAVGAVVIDSNRGDGRLGVGNDGTGVVVSGELPVEEVRIAVGLESRTVAGVSILHRRNRLTGVEGPDGIDTVAAERAADEAITVAELGKLEVEAGRGEELFRVAADAALGLVGVERVFGEGNGVAAAESGEDLRDVITEERPWKAWVVIFVSNAL